MAGITEEPLAQSGNVEPRRDNPYIHARREWAERYGDYVSSARNWRLTAILSLVTTAALAADNWHLANQAKSIPYIVERDRLGNVLYVGVATRDSAMSPLIVKAALQSWIVNARSIISDPFAERHNIDLVYSFLRQGSDAYRMLTAWYADRQPFLLAQTKEVAVDIESVLPLSPSTWQISWTETEAAHSGDQPQVSHWVARITFTQSPPVADTPAAERNPIGLEITSFSWSKRF